VKGIDKIDIQLRPENLGRIEVKMQIGREGRLHAHIVASRPEVMEALQRDVSSLEKAFKDAGFDTNKDSFTFSSKEQENQNKEQGLKDFLGNALESENDLLGSDILLDVWDGKSALNIRV
jgi:flagellar hook-length control protein FliK